MPIESTTDASARRVDAEVDSVEGTATRPSARRSEGPNDRTNDGRIRGARLDGSDAGRIGSTSTSNRPTRAKKRARERAVRRCER